MSRHVLPRRTLLRGMLAGGAAVALPLPRLGGMLNNNGTAYADDAPLIPRYMTWFFGNGIHLPLWVPEAVGKGDAWALSPSLSPLAEFKQWLTVLTGYDNKFGNTFAHSSHPVGLLTGADSVPQGFVQRPTIDQTIAQLINKDTVFPSGLHVGIGNGDGATSMGIQISFQGNAAPNPPNFSPGALFATLLGLGGSQEPDPSLFRRRSVLDAVSQDIKDLKPRLDSADRIRLDYHLDGVDNLQTAINAALEGHNCGVPVNPDEAYPDRGNDGDLRLARCDAFADLLAFAFACELSRVATFMFSCAACHMPYGELGQVGGFHEEYGHLKYAAEHGYDAAIAGYHEGVAYAMTGLARLLQRFRDMPDGDGSLLDHSIIFATSCVADASSHDPFNYPMLLLGKGAGRLAGDLHHKGNAENACKVPFSVLKMLGSTEESYGVDVGYTNETIPELFT